TEPSTDAEWDEIISNLKAGNRALLRKTKLLNEAKEQYDAILRFLEETRSHSKLGAHFVEVSGTSYLEKLKQRITSALEDIKTCLNDIFSSPWAAKALVALAIGGVAAFGAYYIFSQA